MLAVLLLALQLTAPAAATTTAATACLTAYDSGTPSCTALATLTVCMEAATKDVTPAEHVSFFAGESWGTKTATVLRR